ncbi:trypsin-like peptidase domain-containing protein [Hirschia baltica]|nr:trypsin-like peptidase domain-containing protein [Hirschia baltica]
MFDKDTPFGDQDAEIQRLMSISVIRQGAENSVCFIELYKTCENSARDIKLATGTGFFAKQRNLVQLITCWHVVTGLHHETREWLSGTQTCFPDKLKLYFVGREPETNRFVFCNTMVNLYQTIDGDKAPTWNVHPTVGSLYDIVVINLDADWLNKTVIPFKLSKNDAHNLIEAKDSVFVLGHPIDNFMQRYMPIYKRGSIASAPSFPYNTHPKFLIDATTRSGMSGSPVMLHQDPIHKAFRDGRARDLTNINVIGMYSGRESAYEGGHSTELGFVWRIDDIVEVIENGKRDIMPTQGVAIPKPNLKMGDPAMDKEGNFIPFTNIHQSD